jgi:flagellin-like hook-associated protein FlgL
MSRVNVTRIAGNIRALNSLNSQQFISKKLSLHQYRFATCKKIFETVDDPTDMSIATTFDIRRQGMKTALNAIGDASNLLSTTEGGLKKIKDILVKMRNKVLESQGDTIGASEKQAISHVGVFTTRMTLEEALTVALANTESAFSRIMNANMAEEQTEASKLLILQQTATAMLAQANVAPQFLLSLF